MISLIVLYAVLAIAVVILMADRISNDDILDDVAHDFLRPPDGAWLVVTAGVGVAMLLLGLWGGQIFAGCEGLCGPTAGTP